MALNKQIIKENGLECKYWKINQIRISNGNIRVDISGYKSEDIRQENIGYCIDIIVYNFLLKDLDLEQNIYKLCYDLIKQQEQFNDAVDC